jgi:acid phosphatase type 7
MTPTPSNTPTITPTPTATDTPTNTPTPTATPSTFTFTPIADSYVNSGSPTMNYGSATVLRADGSPDLHSYLKFTVSGLSGAPSQVILRLFATSTSTTGVNANGVSDTGWGEKTINYSNMPAIDGPLAGSSGPIKTANTFISINVTSLITGNGTFSIAVTTTNSTAISMASRETGANSPQLVITP